MIAADQMVYSLQHFRHRRTATLEDRMHHLETLIQAIPSAVFAAGAAPSVHPGSLSSSDPTSSPMAPFMYPTHTYPSGVPPPSLHVFPLMNPSTHFTPEPAHGERQQSPNSAFHSLLGVPYPNQNSLPDQLDTSRISLAASYLYFDDEGYTRWQGETSGLPLLDLLVERYTPSTCEPGDAPSLPDPSSSSPSKSTSTTNTDWFPNRTPRRTDINPQTLWRLITSYIAPELMDRCLLHFTFSTCT
jgi:hypothetical protein